MKKILQITLLLSSIGLIGCGGGGSSSTESPLTENTGLSYEGKTTPVIFDVNNAKSFVKFISNSSGTQTISSDVPTANTISKSSKVNSKILYGNTGTVDVRTTKIDNLTTKLVSKFKNYSAKLNSETLTGEITYTITVTVPNGSVIEKMDMSIKLLNIKTSASNLTTDGRVQVHIDTTNHHQTLTQNLITKDNQNNTMFKFENFVIVLDQQNRPLSYTGKVYNSAEGYVVLRTPVKLTYTEGSVKPNIGGEVLYEGKNSVVKERIAYDESVRLEMDEGKDGIVDSYQVYNTQNMEVVANRAPVVELSFPKEIFTNTQLSTVKVNSYDPDLDEITVAYEWEINNILKSNVVSLDNSLFQKHDKLNLKVIAQENKVTDSRTTTVNKEQKVLNSRPNITASFSKIVATIGEERELNYSLSDADNDTLTVSWSTELGYNNQALDDYMKYKDRDCSYAIEEYNREHTLSFSTLTAYEQEDFKNKNCQNSAFQTSTSKQFIVDKTYTATFIGFYKHIMIVSDGDYNRSIRLASAVNTMNLIESQDYNHVPYTSNSPKKIYLKDFDSDANQDVIYMKIVKKELVQEEIVEANGNIIPASTTIKNIPYLTIEYREGKSVLNKVEYSVDDFENYFIHDLNGDAKPDILLTFNNLNDTSDNTAYGLMLQEANGTFSTAERFTLDNRVALVINDVIGNGAEEIIIAKANNNFYNNEVKIYSQDLNQTLQTTLPTVLNNQVVTFQLLVQDIDKNGKKDIIVINKNFKDNNNELNFVCSILSQEDNGSFSEKKYSTLLQENMSVSEYENIIDVKIVTIDLQENIWMITTNKHIYFMKLEGSSLRVLQKIDFDSSKYNITVFNPVDINRDGKLDIVMSESNEHNFVSMFIQKDNLEFLSEQNYRFTISESVLGYSTSVLGDIDKDEKYELFVSTAEENLSVLYFK